ncbi:G1 family glutamic endopeptidase [Flexivirga oryzae]|uniref:Uncharacterized protein n=1 Tax=Flexivirga oryzae TaxID=1794944 RepID=A0A839MZ00_9MICO|nr:G1 family glutamic endopeptidase [Flexivirga oryzae]MBB2890638.1 hypothetical protein [Flexivirga oryzae]
MAGPDTRLQATNLAGVHALVATQAHLTQHDHATTILDQLALPTDTPAARALRERITTTRWPADALIVPHLSPQPGLTHLLTPTVERADMAYTSNNWAGSTISGTWADAVGIWRVPTVSIPETPAGTDGGWDSSSWVGIDGTYGSNDVLQAGVQQSVARNGSTTYVAWYEWYAPKVQGSPGYIYQTNIDNMEVQPGDEVFAGAHYRDGKGFIMFGNVTRGHYFNITLDPPPGATMSGNSVEWIMEAPNSGEPDTSLPAFTPVDFSSAIASPTNPGGPAGDPAKGDTTDIWVDGRSLTSVDLETYSVTITRNAPPWRGFALSPAGSAAAHGIAAVSRIPGSMELWWVAPNGSIQDRYWYDNATWQGFELAPAGSAATTSRIAAVSRIPGSMELWWVAPNGSVQGAYWYDGATWGRYELAPPGSAATSGGIAAVSRIPGSMEVWYVGANGSIQDRYWYDTGTWQGFELAPGGSASLTGGITAVSRIPGSMEVWYVGANGSIQDRYWYDTGTWQGFELAPGGSASLTGGITAVSRIPGSMEVWYVGANGSIQDRYWYDTGTWQGFELAPGGSASLSTGVAATSRIDGSMELWYVAPNGAVRDHFWYDTATWQSFELAPAGSASPGSGVAAVSRIPTSMEVWFTGGDGSVQDRYWYG